MDIREALLELVNSESVRYSYMAIEKIIIVMMRDYLKAQNKRLLAENEVMHRISDMILPDGIDNEDGCIAAEIKLLSSKTSSINFPVCSPPLRLPSRRCERSFDWAQDGLKSAKL